MKKFQIFTVLILFLSFVSCTSNSEDDNGQPDPPANTVTYKVHIAPIISSKCLSCHTNPPINNAPMPLTTYQNVKDAVISRDLIDQIETGDMPPAGADLSDAQVKLFNDWQTGGFKE